MNTTRTAPFWRAFGQPVLAGLLVFLLLLAAFSSTSHALHGWLHHDHQSPSHACLVTLLEHGQNEVSIPDTVALPGASECSAPALPQESFFIARDVVLCPERGPPRLS